MRCPECGDTSTRVVDSRDAGESIRRRRECQDCGSRFSTLERVERRQLFVTKRDGRREPFSRAKIHTSIDLACRKRPFGPEEIDRLVDKVLRRLEDRREAAVPSEAVGASVMGVLRDVDEVAYVRFASVYRAFESVDQFIDAITPLQVEGRQDDDGEPS